MNFSVIKCLFIGLFLSLSFSSKAQTQQWTYYWSYYNPGTYDFRLITPTEGMTEDQYFQQALTSSMVARGASSCASISIAFNDTSTGNVSGPVISRFTNSTSYAYPVKGISCLGYYWGQSSQSMMPSISLPTNVGIVKTICDPGNFVTFFTNFSATCGATPMASAQSSSTGGNSLIPVAQSDCSVCKPGINNTSGYVGDPINLVTGNVLAAEFDYEGVGSNKLKLIRYYNSMPSFVSSSSFNIGLNWLFNYDRRIIQTSSGVNVTLEDGSYLAFNKTGNNSYVTQLPGRLETLLVTMNGSVVTNWKMRRANGDLETYSPAGNLLSIDYMSGGGIDLTWGASGITSVSDRNGHSLQFTRTNGRVTKVTFPEGTSVSYGYDSYGRLVSATNPMGGAKTYEYVNPLSSGNVLNANAGLITVMKNEDGVATFFTYDNQGRATSSSGALNYQRVTLNYFQNSTQVINSLGLSEVHEFSSSTGSIKQATKRTLECPTCFINAVSLNTSYDSSGNITASSDKDGRLSCSTYDTSRNLITSKIIGLIDGIHTCGGSYGSTPVLAYTWVWHPLYAVPLAFSEPNKVTVITRDDNLRPISVTEYATEDNTGLNGVLPSSILSSLPSRSVVFTYLPSGEITSIKSVRNDITAVTYYTYDSNRNLTSVTSPTGLITTYSGYTAKGLPTLITLPTGVTISLTYNPLGLVSQSNYGGAITRYTYSPAGVAYFERYPSGQIADKYFDSAGRISEIVDKVGYRIKYTYDSEGNVLSQKVYGSGGVLSGSVTSTYNSLSRIMSIIRGGQ